VRRTFAALVVLVLDLGLLRAVTGPERVYTVPEVLAGLAHDPRAWAGRAALVWGTVWRLVRGWPRGQWCPSGLPMSRTPGPGPILLLAPAPPAALAARWRSLPLLGNLVSVPQRLRWRGPATYRLRVPVVPHTTCDAQPCITPLLVDAAVGEPQRRR
jgi:hypothetical protein